MILRYRAIENSEGNRRLAAESGGLEVASLAQNTLNLTDTLLQTGPWIDSSHANDSAPSVEEGLDRGLSKKKASVARSLLANQDVVGPAASALAPLVNSVAKQRGGAVRKLVQSTMGVDANAALPEYASETFLKWFGRRQAVQASSPSAPKVVLYVTCFVNHNRPEIGKSVVALLEASGVHVECSFPGWCGLSFLLASIDVARVLPYDLSEVTAHSCQLRDAATRAGPRR
jgi:hypothetical protein